VFCSVVQAEKSGASSDHGEAAGVANGEDEGGATTKMSKKKSKKEDKWKQKMMFLYEDGANPDEDVAKTDSTEVEIVADTKYVNMP